MPVKPISEAISLNTEIDGPADMKIQHYADDVANFTHDHISTKTANIELEKFCKISGHNLHQNKTKCLLLNEKYKKYIKELCPNFYFVEEIKILGYLFLSSCCTNTLLTYQIIFG